VPLDEYEGPEIAVWTEFVTAAVNIGGMTSLYFRINGV
jgi:hypothetical protein